MKGDVNMKLVKLTKAKEGLEEINDNNDWGKEIGILESDILQEKIKITKEVLNETIGGGNTEQATKITGLDSEAGTIVFGPVEDAFTMGLSADSELKKLILRTADELNYKFIGRYTILSYLQDYTPAEMKEKLK